MSAPPPSTLLVKFLAWFMVCVAAVSASLAEEPRRWSQEQLQAHLDEIAISLPEGFTGVIEPPFVVVGQGARESVGAQAGVVRWAVERLRREYFTNDPKAIIEVWLFNDDASYRRHAWERFKERPTTPYGYYSPQKRALIMNIATGGGTLVHEIVHPFMEGNFPDCPAWFNEGLGSLYEQSHDIEGRIRGLTNWRLPGLQEAIRNQSTLPLPKLLATSTAEFYKDQRGINYAQARYLCYYLQEHGKLGAFYREFARAVKTDPGGIRTLERLLDIQDWAEFQKTWETQVLSLRYPS